MSQPTPSAARAAPSQAVGPYVINLCASMTPMALTRPTAPELARFTFFMSRRREEGRERFRLHMGYFQTRDEAEQLLALIRDLYPAAWVGEAPGKRLAARTTAREMPVAPAKIATSPPAAAAAAAARRAPPATQTPAARNAARPAAAPPVAPPRATPARQPATDAQPSNVREVIASLDSPPAPTSASTPAAAPRAARNVDELSDSQVLRILETQRASVTGRAAPASQRAAADIRMLNPDDTQTWSDIRSQIRREAPVHFAVQLAWSVTPIDLEKIPGLAIFNSYTLYKIEGNREGRRWYGLRLGFFSDAVAARQVALYVRSEFASVAVVPVSARERSDAMQIGAIELPRRASTARRAEKENEDEIELIDDAVGAARAPRGDGTVAGAPATAPTPEAKYPAAQPAPARIARRSGHPRGAPQTLEETLEILGASQLTIDDGKGVHLDLGGSTGGRRRAARGSARNSTFAKLLDRLTEKLRG